MGTCPDAVKRLIEHFDRQADQVRSPDYNETLLRIDFVNPLFRELGWDIDNRQGFAEQYREVVHEDRVRVAGANKAPDYSFRIGGTRKFFVETKKPFVNIKQNWEPAYQLRRYGWSAKLAVSLLTDFEELAIYDCRVTPKQLDKPATARRDFVDYRDYCKRWDFLDGTFSKRAVLTGEFDRYCATRKGRGAQEFDEAFLEEIEQWRKRLAANLALRNDALDQQGLNFAVQRIIDRIVFLRICEDRGTEHVGQLQALLNGEAVYPRLQKLFRDADARYNSGLFHFKTEAGREEEPDGLTPSLDVDDVTIKGIIKRLYYPESPYEFTMVSADILGSVYERFLGKVITLSEGHRARIEEKPEVRKAGGVYYTPAYIVDYIVKQTVGRLLADPVGEKLVSPSSPGRSAGDTSVAPTFNTPKEAARLKILDPACGSGSFLLGAYQYLMDRHLQWYVKDGAEKWSRGKGATLRPADRPSMSAVVQTEEAGAIADPSAGHWALTIKERKRILLDNIHGVDIDYQAVEVTKLSLLLKVLEGETAESLGGLWTLFRERALPDLGRNIQCGNSLIGTDIMSTDAWREMSEEERRRVNPFDYERAFPDVFKQGGFDAVIGNPPWGADFAPPQLPYLRSRYERVVDRMIDSYVYLIDQGLRLATKDGVLGYIVPATVLNQVEATKVRRLLADSGPLAAINLGKDIFTRRVLNTSAIVVVGGQGKDHAVVVGDLSDKPLADRSGLLTQLIPTGRSAWLATVNSDPHAVFYVGDVHKTTLLTRLRSEHPTLLSIIDGAIERGVSPDIAGAHVLADEAMRKLKLEPEILKLSMSGDQIRRYANPRPDQWIIYSTRDTKIDKLPRTYKFLKQFKDDNTCPEVRDGKHPFWALHRPRNPSIFHSPKFIGLTTAKTIQLVYDAEHSTVVTDAMYVFRARDGVRPQVVLGVLSSKLFLFLYRASNLGESRVIPQVKAAKLAPLPFPNLDRADAKRLKSLSDLVDSMQTLHAAEAAAAHPQEKERLRREIEATDRRIDQLVYQLYGLTDDETRIVEEATR